MHAHAGYLELARAQARKNIDAMLSPEFDAIVTNAAGCGATMKEYAALLEHDPAYAGRAQRVRRQGPRYHASIWRKSAWSSRSAS